MLDRLLKREKLEPILNKYGISTPEGKWDIKEGFDFDIAQAQLAPDLEWEAKTNSLWSKTIEELNKAASIKDSEYQARIARIKREIEEIAIKDTGVIPCMSSKKWREYWKQEGIDGS